MKTRLANMGVWLFGLSAVWYLTHSFWVTFWALFSSVYVEVGPKKINKNLNYFKDNL